MVRAIIFDCFGVLTTEAWLAFVDSLPDDVDVDQVRNVHRAYTAGMIDKKQCADQIKELSGRSFVYAEDLPSDETPKNTVLLDYIRELRGRGYKIGLLSNIASTWITDTFLTAEEQALFDSIVLSFQVGMVKPDPRIFKLICDNLGAELDETILVDDIDRYCIAAEAEGIHAVVYKDFKQAKKEIEDHLVIK